MYVHTGTILYQYVVGHIIPQRHEAYHSLKSLMFIIKPVHQAACVHPPTCGQYCSYKTNIEMNADVLIHLALLMGSHVIMPKGNDKRMRAMLSITMLQRNSFVSSLVNVSITLLLNGSMTQILPFCCMCLQHPLGGTNHTCSFHTMSSVFLPLSFGSHFNRIKLLKHIAS